MADRDCCDRSRRNFLGRLSQLLSLVGLTALSIPFLSSWWPSAKTRDQGAPIEVDLSDLPPGGLMTVPWRGKPIWILRRTPEELAQIAKVQPDLRDPLSQESEQPIAMQNAYRSLRPDILVLIGVCTHLGCIPNYQPQAGSVSPQWTGGFYCPCHGSTYDLSGRVFKGVPAPLNLAVPPYLFLGPNKLLIGRE